MFLLHLKGIMKVVCKENCVSEYKCVDAVALEGKIKDSDVCT